MKILELENEPLSKLRGMAKTLNIPNANRLKKDTLAMMIREAEAQKEGIELRGGILEITGSQRCGRADVSLVSNSRAPPRRTFCGDPCVHEWRLRTDLTYVREQVFARDRGTCQLWRIDLRSAERRWRRQQPPPHDRATRRRWRRARARWEADHVIPVADGGGDCGLENYRLLCRACHVSVTTAWRRHRRSSMSINPEGMWTGPLHSP